MRRALGSAADQNLFIDTRATGHLLSAPQGLQHFLTAAQAAAAEIIILDPLYSTHDQDENDTRAMAALCQSLLRLREASRAALIVVHHVRKSIGRYEIGSAFRGSSALHAVGDSYLLLTRPSPQFNTVELRFQFRYAAPQPPRLLQLDSAALWFSAAGRRRPVLAADRRKVEPADVRQALTDLGDAGPLYPTSPANHDARTECSKRTAQMAITAACQQARSCRPMATTVCRGSSALLASRSARGRARADAQGRCDGAGSEEIGCPPPARGRPPAGGFLSNLLPGLPQAPLPLSLTGRKQNRHFFGEAPERRPWAIKREIRPAAFAGRSAPKLFRRL